MLVFIFDAVPSFAYQDAKGWEIAFQNVDKKLDLDIIKKIAPHYGKPHAGDMNTVKFGAICSMEGRETLLKNMEKGAEHGIQTTIIVESHVIQFNPGRFGPFVKHAIRQEGQPDSDAAKSARVTRHTASELMAQAAGNTPSVKIMLRRACGPQEKVDAYLTRLIDTLHQAMETAQGQNEKLTALSDFSPYFGRRVAVRGKPDDPRRAVLFLAEQRRRKCHHKDGHRACERWTPCAFHPRIEIARISFTPLVERRFTISHSMAKELKFRTSTFRRCAQSTTQAGHQKQRFFCWGSRADFVGLSPEFFRKPAIGVSRRPINRTRATTDAEFPAMSEQISGKNDHPGKYGQHTCQAYCNHLN